jgi:putative ABC transport system permease protein
MNIRVAFRSLRRAPAFTIAAAITLALGIGAVSAIFSAVNAVLLKPLAGVETQRIVRLGETLPNGVLMARVRIYEEWRGLDRIFDSIGARQFCNPNLTGHGEPRQLLAPCVTANWFAVWKTPPLLGRTFLMGEDQPGRASVVVLSHAFWISEFAGDAGVIGRAMVLDGKPYTIVGVMPSEFSPFGKNGGDIYLPWVLAENQSTSVEVTARLRAGVTIEQARAAMVVVRDRLKREVPFEYKDSGGPDRIQPLMEVVVGAQRTLLRILMAAAALVLLIATVNAASLFLARGAGKRREYEIRTFLGANRRQLMAPAIAESSIVAIAGGVLGLLAARTLVRVLMSRIDGFPRAEEIGVDWRVVFIAAAVSLIAVLVCGGAPSLWPKRSRQGAPVVAQVALTVVLLISSGLLIRGFAAMRQVNLGYDPRGVILGFVAQPEDPQDDRGGAVALWRRVRERIAALPDVAFVATSTGTPAGGLAAGLPIIRENEGLEKAATQGANLDIVSGDYFATVGIPLIEGRTFGVADANTVIVSRSIAEKYFNGRAVGERLKLPQFGFNVNNFGDVTLREIIGVVADVKQNSLAESGRMTMYLPESGNAVRFTTVIAKAKAGDPMLLEREIRAALYQESPKLAIAPMLTLETANAYLTRTPARAMWLLSAFAALALVLAGAGVHGVIAYATAQRSREMGIRMALGARASQLFGLVTGQAMRLAMIGVAIGIAGGYAATRLLESLLFGVTRTDVGAYAGAVAILLAIAAVASFTPAWRASKVDPSVTLRAE